ncbi:hypothetical protein CCR75_009059 [Bremia lactucae]|uniref:Elicitin n=1 Tax=Bremia lactucae TaxID=4779 RepID=A0A976FRV6_BRELC|nr:hypothetical protein CCR75_009059 [Bremia lactucae]
MNFRALFVATVAALMSPTYADLPSLDLCPVTKQIDALASLSSLSEDSYNQCEFDSEFVLRKAKSLPSPAQYKRMCNSIACQTLMVNIKLLSLPNCVLKLPFSGLKINLFSYAEDFPGNCLVLQEKESAGSFQHTFSEILQ